MKAIEADSLGKVYGNGVLGLRDLSMSMERGEVFGFLGPNGAGKSTTVRLLNGTLTPTAGTSKVMGRPSDDPEVRRIAATMGETARMYESLSVCENLRFYAAMYDISVRETDTRIDGLLESLELTAQRDLELGTLSTGMRKRVQLARVLLSRPEVVFLDEPTSGLDPEKARQITTIIRGLADERGTAVFLCTHDLALADGICRRFGFISDGIMIIEGTREYLVKESGMRDRLSIRTTTGIHRYAVSSEEEVNPLVREVMDRGGRIVEVLIERPSLEELYFGFVKEEKNEVA